MSHNTRSDNAYKTYFKYIRWMIILFKTVVEVYNKCSTDIIQIYILSDIAPDADWEMVPGQTKWSEIDSTRSIKFNQSYVFIYSSTSSNAESIKSKQCWVIHTCMFFIHVGTVTQRITGLWEYLIHFITFVYTYINPLPKFEQNTILTGQLIQTAWNQNSL